jgi:hypothetical protein
MVGWDGTIISSLDGGATWTDESFSTGMNFYSVDMLSADAGCICGDGGAILGTTKASGINEWAASKVSAEVYARLLPNYPNPFSGLTNIEYEVLKGTTISIDLVDQFGKVQMNLVQKQFQSPGTYSIVLSETSRLAPGFYYCRLTTNGLSDAMKIIFQK